ncbi:MAG TPA: DUF3426 domain-containing protein [Burkholderiaceae bacterium]|jgi:predicted Zn finger-like uncharacterized protein
MSLATRCTACGTIFRVVQDQLRVSEGWVRCGRCAEVFDARQQLFDVEREAPPPWPAARQEAAEQVVERPGSSALVERAMAQVVNRHHQEPTEEELDEFDSEHISLPAASGFGEPPPSRAAPTLAPEPAAAREEPRWVDDETAGPETVFADTTAPAMPAIDMGDRPDVVLAPSLQPKKKAKPAKPEKVAKAPKPPKTPKTDAPTQPSFMRRAERQARWRRPGVRAAMGVGIFLLAALLGAQAAVHFRDPLAAIYPPVRPVLASLCGLAGCEIEPWRHIDGLSVENTALSQAGQSSAGNQYQLTVALRNKSGVTLALPWVDLSLTDTAGAVVSRRTLAPSDFRTDKGAPVGNALAAGADVPMQVLLATGSLRVSGYTVEIFHP